MSSVDVRSLDVKLTDSALASDLFRESYHSNIGEITLAEHHEIPVRWMAVELLEAVMQDRTGIEAYQPSADVVCSTMNT